VYFYGHRLSYQEEGEHVSAAIAFRSFWRHVGRELPELKKHALAKAVFDVCTLLDYLRVRWRLLRVLRPGTVVVADRYVADVLAFLRFLGPVRGSVEGLLVGTSIEPDIGFHFQIDPEVAFARKQEQTLDELKRFAEAYSGLEDLLGLDRIRAGELPEEVQSQLGTALERKLGIGLGSYPTTTVSKAGAVPGPLLMGQGEA
jgi:thymidylate kinase